MHPGADATARAVSADGRNHWLSAGDRPLARTSAEGALATAVEGPGNPGARSPCSRHDQRRFIMPPNAGRAPLRGTRRSCASTANHPTPNRSRACVAVAWTPGVGRPAVGPLSGVMSMPLRSPARLVKAIRDLQTRDRPQHGLRHLTSICSAATAKVTEQRRSQAIIDDKSVTAQAVNSCR